MDHFGYTIADFIPSELSGERGIDACHIHPRQKGGNENMNRIENLMCKTRIEHIKYGDKKEHKAMLYTKHMEVLDALGKPYDKEWLLAQIEKYAV